MRLHERCWVAVFATAVAVPALGVTGGVWPFVDWPMFASPGPASTNAHTIVGVRADGTEVVHDGERLPGGILREVAEARWQRLDSAGRQIDCAAALADLRPRGTVSVRVESWTWDPLARSGDGPAEVGRRLLLKCR